MRTAPHLAASQGGLHRFRRGLYPVYPLPPIHQLLQGLWGVMGTAEAVLSAVAIMVVAGGLLGMAIMLLASLNERRREMAILRAVGARPLHVGAMFLAEAVLISGFGCLVGFLLLYLGMIILQPMIEAHLGLFVPITPPMPREWLILVFVMIAATAVGLVPALMAYRKSIADGMTVRIKKIVNR